MKEALHWKMAMELHNNKYSKPSVFKVPGEDVSRASMLIRTLDTPTKPGRETPTPSPRNSSPIKATHPKESTIAQESLTETGRLPSLRHPSQLSHRELNLYTFRLYVKFIMLRLLELDSKEPPQDSIHGGTQQNSLRDINDFDCDDLSRRCLGVGISYLMNIPELNLLAERVERETRRQAEKRKILREKENTHSTQERKSKTRKSDISSQKSGKTKKKLFAEAIRTLYQDGSIIIHNGGSRQWGEGESSMLQDICKWKWRKGHSSRGEDASTTFNTTTSVSQVKNQSLVEHVTSNNNEESYIPVTNEVLAQPLLSAIRQATSRLKKANAQQPRVRGASVEDILDEMHCCDERWERVVDIKSALSYLRDEEMIWEVAPSHWAVM